MFDKDLTEAERKALSTCSECGKKLKDKEPRGFWIHSGEMGIHCIACAEADTEAIKFGSAENPLTFE